MKQRLAILAPSTGTLSETFIQRHMNDLLPGETGVVADVEVSAVLNGGCRHLLLGQAEPRRKWSLPMRWSRHRSVAARRAKVSAFLRDQGVEVAMGEYLTWSHQWIQPARDAGVRFFAHAHGYDVSKKLRQTEWRARYLDYNGTDGVIAVSAASRQRLVDLGLEARKVHTIPCGVDVPQEPAVRPDHRLVRCLAVGRMVAKKGPCLTLEAFRLAAARCDRLCLDVIGDGDLMTAATGYVRDFQLHDRVRLHGAQPHDVVQRAMREADIFVQHSRTDPVTGDEEGLPVAILEAMAHALPVVSTRHAGIPEAVVDGVTGLLVDEGDTAGMADCLVALATDPDRRALFGRAGWHRCLNDFSWERERHDLLHVLGLNAPRPAAASAEPAALAEPSRCGPQRC